MAEDNDDGRMMNDQWKKQKQGAKKQEQEAGTKKRGATSKGRTVWVGPRERSRNVTENKRDANIRSTGTVPLRISATGTSEHNALILHAYQSDT